MRAGGIWRSFGVPLGLVGALVIAAVIEPSPFVRVRPGASLHRELECLTMAGLTPVQALAAATSLPANRYGLDDRGRIAPGLRADLMLVEGDPAEGIIATRSIQLLPTDSETSDPNQGRDSHKPSIAREVRRRRNG